MAVSNQKGGFIVIPVRGGDLKTDTPETRHYDTEAEARDAAETFVKQRVGNEAFLVPAEAYFYNA